MQINIQRDEELSIEVAKYGYLYNEKSPFYKDNTERKLNAWKQIGETLGYEGDS